MDIQKLISQYNWPHKEITCARKSYPIEKFVMIGLEEWNYINLASKLDCSKSTISRCVSKYFQFLPRNNKPFGAKILDLFNCKLCKTCGTYCSKEDFYNNSSNPDGKQTRCKHCQSEESKEVYSPDRRSKYFQENKDRAYEVNTLWRERNRKKWNSYGAKYRAAKIQRTAPWADLDKITEIYKDCPEGHHVDHIFPLQGEKVSGLHVETNLQYLTAEENFKKGNRYEP